MMMMKYPVPRLNEIHKNYPNVAWELFIKSRQAVKNTIDGVIRICPTCDGAKGFAAYMSRAHSNPYAVFDCPTCEGKGEIAPPVFEVYCMIGGWGRCPYCFEGQCSEEEPCDVCTYWLEELDPEKQLPRRGEAVSQVR